MWWMLLQIFEIDNGLVIRKKLDTNDAYGSLDKMKEQLRS